ncbi:hypothetical protein FGO68_gene4919 [Halteria grandinella]|uniref:Uncharacterized protein n=1 Tax=Halteria grandinella TaxID=5974 RepID=A0A8J8NS66_HALGN|nr:hypothetical protein FGO68_gene4919 [Halteria grandinella]
MIRIFIDVQQFTPILIMDLTELQVQRRGAVGTKHQANHMSIGRMGEPTMLTSMGDSLQVTVKSHQIDVQNQLKQLRNINVYGEAHVFDEKDPIYTLAMPAQPNPIQAAQEQAQQKACFACLKPNSAEIICQFCSKRSCKDCTAKKRPFPAQQQTPAVPVQAPVTLGQEQPESPSSAVPGDDLIKGVICKVCERKFQMHIFWHGHTPKLDEGEEAIKQAYQETKRKNKELEMIKKDCQDQRQELVSIGTQKLNLEEEKRADREQMEDLVNFAKANVEKLEKRVQDTKSDIDRGKQEKKNEEDNIRNLERQLNEQKAEIEQIKRQNLYLNNLIIYFQKEQGKQMQEVQASTSKGASSGQSAITKKKAKEVRDLDGQVMKEEQIRKYSQQVINLEKQKRDALLQDHLDETETVQTTHGKLGGPMNAQEHMKRASLRSQNRSIRDKGNMEMPVKQGGSNYCGLNSNGTDKSGCNTF